MQGVGVRGCRVGAGGHALRRSGVDEYHKSPVFVHADHFSHLPWGLGQWAVRRTWNDVTPLYGRCVFVLCGNTMAIMGQFAWRFCQLMCWDR